MKDFPVPVRIEAGGFTIVLALLLPVLIGAVGLVADLGFASCYKSDMQRAADAGAYAGAHAIRAKDLDAVTKEALYDASKNGFDGSRGETRTVNHPPSSGRFSGDGNFVEMIISEELPFLPTFTI